MPIVVSAKDQPLEVHGAADGVTALCREVVDETGRAVTDLRQRLREGDRLSLLGAPFAAMLVEDGQATVAADHIGFRHVYGTRQPGWAAISTSAGALAARSQAEPNLEALSVFRIAGHHVDTDTAYTGISKLPPGHRFRLNDGSLELDRYPRMELEGRTQPAAAHAARLRTLVAGFLESHPGAMLELSGGLDSRMVLAAVPRKQRQTLTAFTIVAAGSNDGPVAASLARSFGMRFVAIDVAGLARLTPQEAYDLAWSAAARLDGLGRPLSAASFHWAESQIEQGPRLSGHGGEMARALFGPGVEFERPHAKAPPEVVDNYIRRWIISNDAVPDNVLTAQFAAESRDLAMRRLREVLQKPGRDWFGCLSDFFLRQRMHRFAGITITDGCESRIALNPLVDATVLALVDRVPMRAKAGSRYAVRVLNLLDPELARMPLSSGVRPIALDRTVTLTRRLGENTVRGFLRKAGSKVIRTLSSQRRAAAGAPLLAQLVVAHWRSHPCILHPAMSTGLVSQDYLTQIIDGTVNPDATTVDLLLNLTVIAKAIESTS